MELTTKIILDHDGKAAQEEFTVPADSSAIKESHEHQHGGAEHQH